MTNGEAFSSEESWGDATAVDSAHAADLWFTYKVRNTGDEYAREIADLAFNLYIVTGPPLKGRNTDPVYTYFVGPDLGGDGAFHNFMPAQEHTYTSRRIPLTLDQLKIIEADPWCREWRTAGLIEPFPIGRCRGGTVRVEVEDYAYGADEQYYEDAANAGVLLAMEDGTADGDEAIDAYLIPTWGEETVLDVLGRYFPHTTDENGMLVAVWTPEYRSDTPAWCDAPQVVGTGPQRVLWCRHALSAADWWNIYTDGMGDGSEGFQDTMAAPGQVALFRFNQDGDLDGYSDRSEARLGTNPADPGDHPRPELIAGVHSIQSGNNVVATLSLLNTGLYDAYGVEAVMIAPDETTSITNNTVGGSGRVRAQKQVIVGSRILTQSPLPAAWLADGHAQPAVGGYYEGTADRTYTFTVQCALPGGQCNVGSDAWNLAWNDGAGANGTLSFGAGYLSPNLQAVGAFGLKLGLLSGAVANGESFTVDTRTPRDTFQYEIAAGHESDFTPPLVIVSYNDPQGNHRFVVPPEAMALTTPSDDLLPFSGRMLPDPGVEIVTSAPFAAGANAPDLLVNNPTETTLTDAHLFLEFVDPQGAVVLEVPAAATLPPGPSLQALAFDTAGFDPAYDPAQDYIVMAFLTDYQGNILDTAARLLSSFQEDPRPASGMAVADQTWDLGTAQQGTLLQHTFTLASVGYTDLLAHLGTTEDLSVENPASRSVAPGDTAAYTVTVNTHALPVGSFEETIPVRTSDPAHPERTITIRGNITSLTAPLLVYTSDPYRPWDQTLYFSEAHNAGEQLDFAHGITTDVSRVTPLFYRDQEGSSLGRGRDIAEWAGTSWSEKVTNPGFESGDVTGWSSLSGVWNATNQQTHSGLYSAQPTQQDGQNPVMYQDISLATLSGWVDQGLGGANIQGWLSSKTQRGRIQVIYFSSDNSEIGRYDSGWQDTNLAWQAYTASPQIPVGTDHVRIQLEAEPFLSPPTGQIELMGPSVNNGGFETGNMQDWTQVGGSWDVQGTFVHSGSRAVYGTSASQASFYHDFSLSSYKTWIDAGIGTVMYGGWFSNKGGEQFKVISRFYNQAGGELLVEDTGWSAVAGDVWAWYGAETSGPQLAIPAGTDRVRLEIHGKRPDGDYTDVRVDDMTFKIGFGSGASNVYFDDASLVLYPSYQIENVAGDNTTSRLTLSNAVSEGAHHLIEYGLRQAYTGGEAQTFSVRLPRGSYSASSLEVALRDPSSAPGATHLTLDVGADGSTDWQTTGFPTFPSAVTSGNLAAAITTYMLSHTPDASGAVEVPIRATLSNGGVLFLTRFKATPAPSTDLALTTGDIGFSTAAPVEGDEVTVSATLHNSGTHASGPVTASFFASTTDWGESYVGSAFVPNLAAGGTATPQVVWNTLGFTGTVPVRVTIDPYNRLAETNEGNNEAIKSLTVKTRPDLSPDPIILSDAEPVAGLPVNVTLTLRNNGQTTAGTQMTALSDGNPDAGGTSIGTSLAPTVPGGATRNLAFSWTPAAPGPHRLFVRSDMNDQVQESDEGNNGAWQDFYVGFGAPVVLNSGLPSADPVYTTNLGYGAVDTGLPDVNVTCAGHTDTTLRRDPSNRVGYRFDHLQPGGSYHLDVVLYECDNNQRQERVFVDGMQVAGPVDLGDQQDHAVSVRIDPALYRDHSIDVAVVGEEGSQRGAVAASVALREIDYRYADCGSAADSGATADLAYDSERGWGYLDASSVAIEGTQPYRSARVDQDDAELRYRFDGLAPGKRYRVHLTFWQATGNPLLQRVYADGLDTGKTVNLVAGVPVLTTLRLSPVAYKTDGSVVISIQVLNAGSGAMVNEIALEEETLLTEALCENVRETPNATIAFGALTVNGAPAPAGTVVTAESPRGDVVGCYVVDTAGQYGFMSIYGEDAGASPPIPGMAAGEFVTFRVDGAPAVATPALYWQNDQSPHKVDLNVVPLERQGILLQSGWNLISFRVEPAVPDLEYVLQSISGKYGRVLDENEIWDEDIPAAFRTLKELHGGTSYFLRVDGGSSAYLLVEGTPLPVATALPLHTSWNWPAYLPASSLDVAVALQSISGSYQKVLSLNQYYDVRYPTYSTLKQMAPNQGYRIYATQPATLVYPSTAASVAEEISPSEAVSSTTLCNVSPTPDMTLLFGQINIDGQPAPVGTLVEAITPRGEVAGCFEVDAPGQYGFMNVYGEDPAAEPPIPGFRADEPIVVRVNGREVPLPEEMLWQNDLAPHQVDLGVDLYRHWLPLIAK